MDYPVVKESGIGGRPLRRMNYIEAKRRVSVVEIFTVIKCHMSQGIEESVWTKVSATLLPVFTGKLLSPEKKNKSLPFWAKNTSVERKVVI